MTWGWVARFALAAVVVAAMPPAGVIMVIFWLAFSKE